MSMYPCGVMQSLKMMIMMMSEISNAVQGIKLTTRVHTH